jgi:gas vesicle protein
MNHKKFIERTLQTRQDNGLTIFAILAGIAAGAAIAVLFAPKSGRESRKILAEKLNFPQHDHRHELEDESIDDLREIIRDHADQLQGPQNKRKDPTQIKVPSAGTTAWKKSQ